ncbi:MAG: NAD(P)-binding protein, partial [Bdellovibrionales bacterium]|nr:NAD(P)-binding protein [Bdellovibrionales bacterium]
MTTAYEIAIIGAGLAGSACAFWCSQNDITGVVIDRASGSAQRASGNIAASLVPYLGKPISPRA